MATIKKDIGAYSAYAIAVKYGYEGTEAEWVAAQEQARVDSEAAAKAAKAAQEAAETAREQAQTAKTGAETAQGAAGQAAQAAREAASTATQAAQSAQAAKEAAEQAQTGARNAKTGAETARTDAQSAKTAAEEAAKQAQEALTGALEAKTGAEAAQRKAEEAAQGVAADREQIGANKSGLEAAQQELTAAKEQLAETKTALTTTQEDLKKAQRAIQFQAELNKGQTWDFETDDSVAYSRTVPSGAKAGAVMEISGKTRPGKNVLPLVLPKNEQNTFATVSGATISVNNTANKTCFPQTEWFELPAGTYCACQSDADVETYFQVASSDYSHTLKGAGNIVITLDATTQVRYMLSVGAGINISMSIQTVRGSTPDYDFEPYTPDLLSAQVDEVRVVGKNLVEVTGAVGDNNYPLHFPIPAGTTLSASFTGTASADNATALTAWLHSATGYVAGNSLQFGTVSKGTKRYTASVTVNYVVTLMRIFKDSFWTLFASVDDFQLEIAPAPTSYSPYRQTIHPIPAAVRNLPGYGWSAGSVANTVERTDNGWQYVQRVGSVDLGSLSWTYSASKLLFSADVDGAVDTGSSGYTKLECAILMPGNAFWGNTTDGDGEITINHGVAIARKMAYDNVDDFTSFVSGHPLYYELATPITTDITALMGDALAPFAVEAGGSITLHHPKAEEGFAIDVPGKVQYITKLSEVSANG